MLKYFIYVLGCQMNYADAERLASVLSGLGYKKSVDEKSADLVAVVACSVRQGAVDRIFGKARDWQKKRRQGKLLTILTGCVLKSDEKTLREKFDLILNIKDIGKLPKLLKVKAVKEQKNYFHLVPQRQSKFQAVVPIMTGCNNFCAYCVVPYVRGREISRPATELIRECRTLIKNGCKEIFLLGQNVNSYKSGRYDFPKLLAKIDRIKGDWWLRFATSHPKDLSAELIEIMARGAHLTPYLQLPIQAGDKKILKAMNRKYTPAHYLKLVKAVRQAIPDAMISTDVIVGFPGESREQFLNTVKIFKQVQFDMAYIAQYSPRQQTVAFKLKDDVSKKEKKRRWQILNETLKITALARNKKLVSQTLRVLVEECKNDQCSGKTDTFKTAIFPGRKNLIGRFAEIKINRVDSWGLFGEKK